MAGERHRLRAVVLQALYEIDAVGHKPDEALERQLDTVKMSSANRDYARALVEGVVAARAELDVRISAHAPHWPVSQMSLIDRNILRLAIFEILQDNKVPVKVSINEAVELAKSYGGDNSYRFINGVLGAISAQAERHI